jgi:mycothiol system anti-sigma-R factor
MGERHGHADDDGCRDAVARLYWFLDGELTVERRAAIQHHLDECSDCIEAYEFELELRLAIARGCREAVPEALRQRVFEALSGDQPDPAI